MSYAARAASPPSPSSAPVAIARGWRAVRTPVEIEDEIVELRKALSDQGLDAGAHTIAYHLGQRHEAVPAVATIWRILSRRGFVTPQPQKRPRSSFIRFEAAMPNERWQADITHWVLAGRLVVAFRPAVYGRLLGRVPVREGRGERDGEGAGAS